MCYILVITMCAFDFWVVKNVSGRILVGLRYWSKVKDDGKEIWFFESMGDHSNKNRLDRRIFWTGQYFMACLWFLFAFASFFTFSFSNTTVCLIALTLTATNLLGYIKCDKKHQKNVGNYFFKKAKDNMSTKQMTQVGMYAMNN